jgi:hypothetical protein
LTCSSIDHVILAPQEATSRDDIALLLLTAAKRLKNL